MPPVPSFDEVTVLVVLTFAPDVVAVTFTVIVHVVVPIKLPIDPPLRLMLPEPATAVSVPLQPLLAPLGVDTTSPEGSESVNAMPVIVLKLFELPMVMVRTEVPFTPTVVGLNVLVMVGTAADATGAVKALASNRMAAASSRFMMSTLPVSGGERGRR